MEAAAGLSRPPARRRPVLAAWLGVTIALGLGSRAVPLPGPLAGYPGDALYTVAAFWALLLVLPRLPGGLAAGAALVFSALVELSQLCDAGWLVALRQTGFGALLLGQGFQVADLLSYACGAIVAFGLDRLSCGPGRGRGRARA